jgi:hypothetical protein
MTCDGYDVIANSINVPEMEVGDWIVVGGKLFFIFKEWDHIL